jgi:hypothetical protein
MRDQKKVRSYHRRADGVVSPFLTTPSAPIKGCLRRYFLRSRPPLLYEEGTSSSFQNLIPLGNMPQKPASTCFTEKVPG